MNLIVKFNAVLLCTVTVGLGVTGVVANHMLQDLANAETLQSARLMMASSSAMRSYTNTHVKPLLEKQMKHVFLPESVPSFVATEVFTALSNTQQDYHYKEATLNPTNPRSRTTDWEADVVKRFRADRNLREFVGERDTPSGRELYLARPIQVDSPNCLQCHSTPDVAPKPMIEQYGTANGFGWKLHEVVGAQIVSVPSRVPLQRAQATLGTFMLSITGVFGVVFLVLNLMLSWFVIRPVTRLAAMAERASMGHDEPQDFQAQGNDEISALTRAFARMRTSLQKAMHLIEA